MSDNQVVYTSSEKVGHCLFCVNLFMFSQKLLSTVITNYFRLIRILRVSLATGPMDAFTFTSDVCITFMNRFVLKGSTYGYG